MDTTTSTPVVIKFDQLREQSVAGITRISGFVQARNFIPIIDVLDLEANPRSSKVGKITTAIIESITTAPEEFPFKTKGVLLGATRFEILDRGRVRIECAQRDKEGILDGGHNTLAIGLHLLALAGVPDAALRKVRDWPAFRAVWRDESERVQELRRGVSSFGVTDAVAGELSFLVPVELIVPSDPDDEALVDAFQSSILEICAARNNNAELPISTKADKKGYFDPLKDVLAADVRSRIEWKTGETAPVKAADLIALTWIPLSLLDPMPHDEDEKPVAPPIPQNLYRNKGECMQKFSSFMQQDAVTVEEAGKSRLVDPRVASAFSVAADLPELYDLIASAFPEAYNSNDGSYGRIVAVKKMNPDNGRPRLAKFTAAPIKANSPEGFLTPLVYGLIALMKRDEGGMIRWVVDPREFIEKHITAIAAQYKDVISAFNWDPMKVGKAPLSYNVVKTAYTTLLAADLAAAH